MYESHHQSDYTIPKNPMTEFDYQLLMDVNAIDKYNPNLIDYNHPEYLALMQAHSNQLDLSMTEKQYKQNEYSFGLNSNNNSNEYFKKMDHQSSMDMHFASSLNLSFSNADSPHFSSGYLASSVPPPPTMAQNVNHSSQTPKNDIKEEMIEKNYVPTTNSLASSSPSSSHYSLNQQYLAANPTYQQSLVTTSDPSVYPSLEGYMSTSNPSSSFDDNSLEGEENDISNAAGMHDQYPNNHLEQFYCRALDEQQHFFLMQQQRQKTWVQQQHQKQQALGYSHNQHGHTSPSSFSSTAYTTENESRAQIYVRKACVSCKQSHVACDVQRPCSRCVRLNKTESCVDAERKKRGRPCGSGKKKKEEEKEKEFRRQQQQYF
ncbi:hypothetical protein BCR42DRAFT_393984 [Absidia repens]|uniref:Zn(2)-C6 fungal-type domain-containing protein n=1 Tax=Absidia repens TaxID=90262 RepID=A0A1X2IBW6_9FUNG|nr:hypothetical protein BCR42DRAFT_393984 [Absidia repens]